MHASIIYILRAKSLNLFNNRLQGRVDRPMWLWRWNKECLNHWKLIVPKYDEKSAHDRGNHTWRRVKKSPIPQLNLMKAIKRTEQGQSNTIARPLRAMSELLTTYRATSIRAPSYYYYALAVAIWGKKMLSLQLCYLSFTMDLLTMHSRNCY